MRTLFFVFRSVGKKEKDERMSSMSLFPVAISSCCSSSQDMMMVTAALLLSYVHSWTESTDS